MQGKAPSSNVLKTCGKLFKGSENSEDSATVAECEAALVTDIGEVAAKEVQSAC